MQEKTAGGTPAAPIKLDVSVRVIEPVKNLMGFASVKFNDCFVVENLKIVQGSKGLFLGMPSQPDGKGGYPVDEHLRRGRRPGSAGICLFFPGTSCHLGKGGAHAGGPEPDGRNVPCTEKLPVGRGTEL